MKMPVKKTLIILLTLVMLLSACTALCEHYSWDCPECGRTGNTGNYCGSCAHPAPWMEAGEAVEEAEPAYEAPAAEPVFENLSGKVGIAFPTQALQRWSNDGNGLKEQLTKAGLTVNLQFADNDAQKQLQQIEKMISGGCQVLVIAAVDYYSLDNILSQAKGNGVTVIAYDRLLYDTKAVDYYVTFDNYTVGAVQGRYIVDRLGLEQGKGPFTLEITAGDPGDINGYYFYQGGIDVLQPYIDSGKLVVKSGQVAFSDVSTSGWNPEEARKRAERILKKYYTGKSVPDAWLCSNDSTALGVTLALKASGKKTWPIITGQDCDRENLKNIIAGKQSMSVFKDTRILVDRTARMVEQAVSGSEVEINDTETYNNNKKNVPAYLCSPVVVDISNYKEILVKSGFYSESELR